MKKRFNKILTKEFLNEEYIKNKISSFIIAKNVGCSFKTVLNYLREFNLVVRSNSEAQKLLGRWKGKDNPQYKDGRDSKKYYCKDCGVEICSYGRSTYCNKCKFNYFPKPFKGRQHTEKSRKLIGIKSKQKFTKEYIMKIRDKHNGDKSISIGGYIYLVNYTHPNRNSSNHITEHVLVMSEYLGRPLDKKEIVHHIDGDKLNNKVENLYLFSNRGEHMSSHMSMNKLIKPLLENDIIKFEKGTYKLKEVKK